MNPNADYLGIVTMLRSLREQGLVSGSEAKAPLPQPKSPSMTACSMRMA